MASDYVNSRQMWAEVIIKNNENNDVVIKCGTVHLVDEHFSHSWKIKSTLKSFEVMHGLSRVMLLVPDKLATAISINKECLQDPVDDGRFLIDLVQNLVTFYKERHFRQNFPLEIDCESVWVDITGSRHDEFNNHEMTSELFDVLSEFSIALDTFKHNLKDRDEDEITSSARAILQMADHVLEVSNTYMDFIHPMMLDIERNRVFNVVKCKELKMTLQEKMSEQKNKLSREFCVLTNSIEQ